MNIKKRNFPVSIFLIFSFWLLLGFSSKNKELKELVTLASQKKEIFDSFYKKERLISFKVNEDVFQKLLSEVQNADLFSSEIDEQKILEILKDSESRSDYNYELWYKKNTLKKSVFSKSLSYDEEKLRSANSKLRIEYICFGERIEEYKILYDGKISRYQPKDNAFYKSEITEAATNTNLVDSYAMQDLTFLPDDILLSNLSGREVQIETDGERIELLEIHKIADSEHINKNSFIVRDNVLYRKTNSDKFTGDYVSFSNTYYLNYTKVQKGDSVEYFPKFVITFYDTERDHLNVYIRITDEFLFKKFSDEDFKLSINTDAKNLTKKDK